ncbi:hypothetical protein [Haliangium sp. UPWRP_2]|uniref:hypothetical protein n=1 Tax=Haliangium sp. UPWRP_2 TaxID=1931276 RepID=UPI001304E5A9|nr:hypothetical protein [Haliangium sp. UPWRP_2]
MAAFAVEQIAQGTLDALQQANVQQPYARIFAAFALITLVVRFFHGNSIYLAREYSIWHHRDLPTGHLLATPLRYFRDLLFQLLEYLLLVCCGYYTSKDPTLFTSSLLCLSVLLVDVVWLLLAREFWRKSDPTDAASGFSQNWLLLNLGGIIILGACILTIRLVSAHCLGWALAIFLIVQAYVDYHGNYNFYFSNHIRSDSVPIRQAGALMACLHAFAVARVKLQHEITSLPAGLSPQDRTVRTKEHCMAHLDRVCQYLFQKQTVRTDIFCRDHRALLHIGVYYEYNGELRPLFRCASKPMHIRNQIYGVGSSRIGKAYAACKELPGTAKIYHRNDGIAKTRKNERKFDQQYQSSVLTNIPWPLLPTKDQNETPLGTITLTANVEQYFTEGLHDKLALALAREVCYAVHCCFGDKPIAEIKKQLNDLAEKGPHVAIPTK